MSLLNEKLTSSIANKVASFCEKSVDAAPEVYTSFFFGHEISLSVDEESEES